MKRLRLVLAIAAIVEFVFRGVPAFFACEAGSRSQDLKPLKHGS